MKMDSSPNHIASVLYERFCLESFICDSTTCKNCFVNTIIKALEKQIPKKPNKAIDHTWGMNEEVPVCPACDYYLTPVEFIDCTCETTGKSEKLKVTYCDHCGQAIDWSEVRNR